MKRITVAMFLILALLISLTGCGNSGNSDKKLVGFDAGVHPDSITGEFVNIQFNAIVDTETGSSGGAAGQALKLADQAKMALDAVQKLFDTLDTPYSINVEYGAEDNGIEVSVKVGTARIGLPLILFMGSGSGFSIQSQFKEFETSFLSGIEDVRVEKNNDDTYSLVCVLSESSSVFNSASEKLAGYAKENIGENIYLTIGEDFASALDMPGKVTVSGTSITEDMSFTNISFSSILFNNKSTVGEKDKYIFDLIAAVYEMNKTVRLDVREIENPNHEKTGISLSFSVQGLDKIDFGVNVWTAVDEITEQNAQTIYDDVNVYRPNSNIDALRVEIPIETNEEMPTAFIKAIEDIYLACGFDDGSYSKVEFMNAELQWNMRLCFKKEESGMRFSDSDSNVSSDFKTQIDKVISESEFFQKKK